MPEQHRSAHPAQRRAVLSQTEGAFVTQRDAHVLMMEALDRLGWREAAGYGKRSLVETAMGRYKGIIGARLRSRSWTVQQHEAAIGVAVLNRMTEAGRPSSVRTGGVNA